MISMKTDGKDVSEIYALVKELNYLHEISQRISEKKDLHVLLNEIMESCKELMNAEASSLMIYDEKDDRLHFQVATGEKGEVVKSIAVNMGEGIAGWVAQYREPLLIEDCYKDPRFNPEYDRKSNFRTKSMICVPMIRKDRLVGIIQVINKKNDGIFTERDLNIFSTLASQCAISIENARLTEIQIQQKAIERELNIAREIQLNLLPSSLPVFSDLDVAFRLESAKKVGGDYFNVYKINDHETLFFICDVSGKSVSAALIVSTICSSLLTYFKMIAMTGEKFSLFEMIKSLNRVLIELTTDEKFVTGWFGLYNHATRNLSSINAGHNTIFLFKKNGELIELKEGGIFLGTMDLEYTMEEIILDKNDTIVCYTDGVPEALNSTGEFYTEERLIEFVKLNLKKSSHEILNGIYDDVSVFVNGFEQSDDITCGVIRLK